MSVQAMAWAIEQQDVADAPARHVLLCLANYADARGDSAFPSAGTLARDTGLSERTIRSKLDLLRELGVIVPGNQRVVAAYIDRLDKRPVCYKLNLSRGAGAACRSPSGVQDVPSGVHLAQSGVQLTQERGAALAERGAGAAPNPSFNRHKEPPIEPPLNQSAPARAALAKKPAPESLPELPDWIPVDAWAGFVEMRKSLKAPLTWNAAKLIVAELDKFMQAGQSPRAVLEQSIMNGWRGVFAVKVGGSQGGLSRDAFNAQENAKAKRMLFGPDPEAGDAI